MFGKGAFAVLLLVCVGLARRNWQLREELAVANWTIAEKLEKELADRRNVRPATLVYAAPTREEPARGGDAA